jgi:hypothetical protein
MTFGIDMVLMRRAGTFNKIIMEKAEKLQIFVYSDAQDGF